MRRSVDLPHPDGPTSAKNVPRSTARSTPATAGVSPNAFSTPAHSRSAAATALEDYGEGGVAPSGRPAGAVPAGLSTAPDRSAGPDRPNRDGSNAATGGG